MGRRPKAALEGLGESREFQVKVGLRIKDARTRAGLSQEDLAQAMEVTQSFIYLLESGKQNMTVQTLARVAQALDTTVSALLPQERGAVVSTSNLVDLMNSLDDIVEGLRTRSEQDRRLLEQLEKLLATVKLMCDARGGG